MAANKPPPKTAVMANVSSALVVQHLTVRRGDVIALHDINLEIRPLELHGIVGPTGAGKSTLLEALAGIVPAIGDVMLGHVPLDREMRRRHVFFVPDPAPGAAAPFADERVADVLRFAARSLRSEAALDDVTDRLDVRSLGRRRMGALSKGERKRALVALSLLVTHGFVLLDEPFEGLTMKEARALQNVLRTSTNENRALLVALHQMGDAERLCDRFTLLDSGRVVGAGPLHELRAQANAHPGAALEEVFLALA